MSDVTRGATTLLNSLGDYKPIERPGRQVAAMFNSILEAAKEDAPNDLILRALEPLTVVQGSTHAQAGEIRAMLQQILNALGEGGPSIG